MITRMDAGPRGFDERVTHRYLGPSSDPRSRLHRHLGGHRNGATGSGASWHRGRSPVRGIGHRSAVPLLTVDRLTKRCASSLAWTRTLPRRSRMIGSTPSCAASPLVWQARVGCSRSSHAHRAGSRSWSDASPAVDGGRSGHSSCPRAPLGHCIIRRSSIAPSFTR